MALNFPEVNECDVMDVFKDGVPPSQKEPGERCSVAQEIAAVAMVNRCMNIMQVRDQSARLCRFHEYLSVHYFCMLT